MHYISRYNLCVFKVCIHCAWFHAFIVIIIKYTVLFKSFFFQSIKHVIIGIYSILFVSCICTYTTNNNYFFYFQIWTTTKNCIIYNNSNYIIYWRQYHLNLENHLLHHHWHQQQKHSQHHYMALIIIVSCWQFYCLYLQRMP